MWNGKKKALTFSYDDGNFQDIKLIDIFNKYGMKATFNLNSGLMNDKGDWVTTQGRTVRRLRTDNIAEIYKGHEVAVHCATHPHIIDMPEEELRREILDDKAALEKLFDCKINGMAYPYGEVSPEIMRITGECGIKFSRTCWDLHGFQPQTDLLMFRATCHHNYEKLWELVDEFLAYDGDEPIYFCLWGHSYEFDIHENWQLIEEFCRKLSDSNDIFYGTNSEVLLEQQL
ncbi:MAG: polysaccharide deacetylase family protein [Ruminococcus sp.]|nr:polysaccharide deacetylase family protein [Ruminococcus sp.]